MSERVVGTQRVVVLRASSGVGVGVGVGVGGDGDGWMRLLMTMMVVGEDGRGML